MKQTPLLFQSNMVRALLGLDGLIKTNTRRIAKPQPIGGVRTMVAGGIKSFYHQSDDVSGIEFKSPYSKGELIWVKETHQFISPDEQWRGEDECKIIYRATDKHPGYDAGEWAEHQNLKHEIKTDIVYPWRSSLFLKKKYSRLTLKITDVSLERVKEILFEECIKEGLKSKYSGNDERTDLKKRFIKLWNSINAKPKPVYTRDDNNKKIIDHYVSYPWEEGNETEAYRGKKHFIYGNPYVWAIAFDVIKKNIDEYLKEINS